MLATIPKKAPSHDRGTVPASYELAPELWHEVLMHLSMPHLQLLKAVCHAMAQHCRAVLRSEAWQTRTPLNEFALCESIKTQVHAYRLPLMVSIYPQFLPKDAQCLATIHRMKLATMNTTLSEVVHPVNASQFKNSAFYDRNTNLVLLDLCIEVHGEGIVTSETALRQVLQRVLRTRGKPSVMKEALADSLWNYVEDPTMGASWPYRWREDTEEEEESVRGIVTSMRPVTQIRAGKWVVNQAPWCNLGCEDEDLDLRGMCEMGLGLFV